MEPKDTAPAETVLAPTPESAATPQATGTEVEPAKEQTPPVAEDSPEELRKQLQKLEQERNLYKNKNKEYETAQEEKRKAELSEAELLKEELAEYRAKEAGREAEQLRRDLISKFPDEATRKAALQLIEKNPGNLTWGDASTEEEAQAALFSQMEAIQEVIGSKPADPAQAPAEPVALVNPNNPGPHQQPSADRMAQIQEAAKKGDFSSLIKSIPSVQQAIKQMQDQ